VFDSSLQNKQGFTTRTQNWLIISPEGKFLVTKFEFGGSFGMRFERDCHEVEVTPNLELLVNLGMSWEGVWQELYP
jgi:hypothetical protein